MTKKILIRILSFVVGAAIGIAVIQFFGCQCDPRTHATPYRPVNWTIQTSTSTP